MTTTALQQFLASLDHTPGREEIYDTVAVEGLPDVDRRVAEDALIARAQAHDPRAVLTLAALECRRALPELDKLAAEGGAIAPFARRAVLRLRGGEHAAKDVATDVARGGRYQRFAAVAALGEHGGEAARQALDHALDDPDPLVRMQAAEGLFEALHLTPYTRNAADDDVEPRSPLRRLYSLVSADLPSLHRKGVLELRRIASELAAGKTPAELDLIHRPSADPDFRAKLVDALMDAAAPIPLDLIRRGSPHDRAFAETLFALRLQSSVRDPRAPEALADLDARWTLPVLTESLHELNPGDPFAVAATRALGRMHA